MNESAHVLCGNGIPGGQETLRLTQTSGPRQGTATGQDVCKRSSCLVYYVPSAHTTQRVSQYTAKSFRYYDTAGTVAKAHSTIQDTASPQSVEKVPRELVCSDQSSYFNFAGSKSNIALRLFVCDRVMPCSRFTIYAPTGVMITVVLMTAVWRNNGRNHVG